MQCIREGRVDINAHDPNYMQGTIIHSKRGEESP